MSGTGRGHRTAREEMSNLPGNRSSSTSRKFCLHNIMSRIFQPLNILDGSQGSSLRSQDHSRTRFAVVCRHVDSVKNRETEPFTLEERQSPDSEPDWDYGPIMEAIMIQRQWIKMKSLLTLERLLRTLESTQQFHQHQLFQGTLVVHPRCQDFHLWCKQGLPALVNNQIGMTEQDPHWDVHASESEM